MVEFVPFDLPEHTNSRGAAALALAPHTARRFLVHILGQTSRAPVVDVKGILLSFHSHKRHTGDVENEGYGMRQVSPGWKSNGGCRVVCTSTCADNC